MRLLQPNQIDEIHACRASGEYVWIDLVDPAPDLLVQTGEALGWHPLLVEDLEHGDQRPKIEDFSDHSFVVTYAAVRDAKTNRYVVLEHALVVHGDYLVTVRRSGGISFASLHAAITSSSTSLTEAGLVHRVLDLVVDTTMDTADMMVSEVERLERAIDDDSEADMLDRLRECRRDVVGLRGLVVAQRDALESLGAALESLPGFELGMRNHFRDVTDHSRRVVDQLDTSRDLLDAAFEAYYATLVARQGAVSQRLTVIATIFLPLTFVTGFFGQNFTWMVDHVSSERDFLVYGVGTTVGTGLLLAVLFKRLRWW